MNNGATAFGIFALSFAALAYLAQSQSPNDAQAVTRLGLTLSIVESGQLNIDRFADNTIDKAFFNGHYYTDKPPGMSFLAIPVLAATVLVINVKGGSVDSDRPERFAYFAKIAIIAVNAFISGLATAALFLTAIRLGATRNGALLAAGTLAFATPFFGWSTVFFSHSVSASLLMLVAAAITFAFTHDNAAQLRVFPVKWGLGLGMLLGFTLVVDLTAAPACFVGGALVLALAAGRNGISESRLAFGLILGGSLGLLPLLVYNQLAFDSPFTLGYSKVVGFEGMQHGFFGISWPHFNVIFELLFGPYRGLIPLSPVLLLVPVGLYVMWRNPKTHVAAAAILTVILSFVLLVSSYHYWHGHWSTGPRHLVPMLPLSCLAIAFAWPSALWARMAAGSLLAASLLLSLICAVSHMFAPPYISNPLVDFLMPIFFTPEKLLKSVPIIMIWLAFGAMFLLGHEKSSSINERENTDCR